MLKNTKMKYDQCKMTRFLHRFVDIFFLKTDEGTDSGNHWTFYNP